MWTLVLWFYLIPGDLRSVSNVPGFSGKNACEAAAPQIVKAVLLDSLNAPKARAGYVCVYAGS